MLMFAMFTWWYGLGWRRISQLAWLRLERVGHLFSAPILLRTLFSPWRRIVTYPGAGIDAQLKAMVDNLVSRMIGFTIRLFVLVAAGVAMLATGALGGLFVIIWPAIPLLIPGLIVVGVIGV